MPLQTRYDYIIAGAGSAGCVLARRLADAGHQVLLLEMGTSTCSWVIDMPAGLRSVFKPSSKYNWWYYTQPQTYLNNRKIQQPRGKVLGGSSSINGMTWLRGHPLDYERWHAEGARQWDWAHCLPYFKKIENCAINSDYRGNNGFVGVQRVEKLNPLNNAFLEAGQQAGWLLTDDVNGYQQEGVSRFDMSVKNGIRNSSAFAYLRNRATVENLTIWQHCQVHKINVSFSNRATGYRVLYKGNIFDVSADKEVILSAGVFGSPQLLLLSGIGPDKQLASHGIHCKVPLPGVGENLQDHLECHIQIESKQPVSLNRELQFHRMLWAGIQWFVAKKGVAAVNQCHVGAFVNSSPHVTHPDIQFHFFPVFLNKDWMPLSDTYGFRIGVGPMRPTSRGTVRLRSSNINDSLLIDPNYMSTQEDWHLMRKAMNLGLDLISQAALQRYCFREDSPGIHIRSTEKIDAFIRNNAASAYHPCGTCKIGTFNDKMAVVDSELKVHGVENLRVIDASVMPSLPSANINATTIMLAERASDMVMGNTLLEPQMLRFRSR